MFCDLVGFTELAERRDAEELREIVGAYHEVCANVIGRFEGHIAQYLGDGLLVYFGYPRAHEDDARRAVHTGLEIVEAVGQLNVSLRARRGVSLAVRVGLHTGTVVVGDVGAPGRSEQLAHGETPNLASRIQALARPDSVVISHATHRLVEGLFRCRDLGSHELRGVSTPMRLHEVLGEGRARHRLEAAATRLTPLVGRGLEVELLLERWQQAKDGLGQVVLLSGEAGIGKSRLVRVLKERLAEESKTWLECRGSVYHQHSAFYPVIELLERAAGITRQDRDEEKLTKIQTELAPLMANGQEDVPLYAALFSVSAPVPAGDPSPRPSPQRQKQRTLEALVGGVLTRAQQQPVLLILEDLQWMDPSTLELIELIVDHTPKAPMLTLLTFRPDFRPPWASRAHQSPLTLNRLTRQQTEVMVTRLIGGKVLASELLQQIVARTDGIPLFVEELTKMVLESGWLRDEEDHYALARPLPPLSIPTTLQASLTARLDRLEDVKEVAQLGATLGRAFSYELIRAVARLDEGGLQERLARLVDAELLHQRGLPPHTSYLFKHALVQEAAYESLLKRERQEHHLRIAEVLVGQFADVAATQPELVAHHYTEADSKPQAIVFWQRAGRRAVQRSAHVEAIRHLRKGLELLQALPDSRERAQQELALQGALGVSLMATRGYASLDVEATYTRARELCEQLGDTRRLLPVLMGLLAFYLVRADLRRARQIGEQLLAGGEAAEDPAHRLNAHYTLAHVLFFQGEFGPTREHAERAAAVYDPAKHNPHATGAGQDPGVSCLSYASLALWMLGYPDQALRKSEEALAHAQQLSHTFSRAYALGIAAMFRQCRGEVHAVEEHVEAMIPLCQEQEFAFHLGWATILRAWSRIEQGPTDQDLDQMRQGLTIFESTGAEILRPYWLALQAEACRRLGRIEEGLAVLSTALDKVRQHGERFYEAELHRLTGTLLLATGADRAAEACFVQAIDVAREQGARSLELRATVSLSRLYQRQAKTTEARRQLAELYAWFSEGFETADLTAARTLLAELA
jgi:class 3 adenylate cyclase/predicted ATPase